MGSGAVGGAECSPTPLDRSWVAVSMLLVWFAAYAVEGASALPIPGPAGRALACAAAGVLVGLAVFVPANPSALGRRVAVYVVPVLALTLLIAASREDFYTVLPLGFLPAWALLCALYGEDGGLPDGRLPLCIYLGIAAAGVVAGAIAVYVISLFALAGLPAVDALIFLPLLQLFLLLRREHRRRKLRTAAETGLSALLVFCASYDVIPGTNEYQAAFMGALIYIVAVVPTAAVVTVGRI
ncbi:hypothetical protein [Arthrobacter sp. zg-Y1143]|uniref:hypothetical protein n=1 Tax=Arthrobacter sp. zg-Y1143 TaxID=3049065 RepID=UPI0024C3C536|nr:hypothetical protein [Arthrobacter sp. zg-Y1143]MDK1329196.1 hypothetical protein [Arthrobacter sp. zg-Y1143]